MPIADRAHDETPAGVSQRPGEHNRNRYANKKERIDLKRALEARAIAPEA
jgi:hypothetical protein